MIVVCLPSKNCTRLTNELGAPFPDYPATIRGTGTPENPDGDVLTEGQVGEVPSHFLSTEVFRFAFKVPSHS